MKQDIVNENQFTRLFRNDNLSAKPDPAIRERLNYTFSTKWRSTISRNSVVNPFPWAFLYNQMPFKPVVVVLLFLLMIFNIPENPFPGTTSQLDSLNYIKSLKTDSAKILTLPEDSCFFKGS